MLKEIKTRYVRHAQILFKIKKPQSVFQSVRQEESENNCAVSVLV